MSIGEATFHSDLLQNTRRLWVQPPPDGMAPATLCILLDGEYYVEEMSVTDRLMELQAVGDLPPLAIVYVSYIDGDIRWHESFCNSRFASFLSQELVPWAHLQFKGVNEAMLGGLSLTGLAAAHAALSHPSVFEGAICQSASFWWSDNQLVKDAPRMNAPPQTYRIICGSRETEDYVEHSADLIQTTSQLRSNQAMRDVLLEMGHKVSYDEYDGGHETRCWETDLPNSMKAWFKAHAE